MAQARHSLLLIFFYTILGYLLGFSAAQNTWPGPPPNSNPWQTNFNPAMGIIVVILLSTFFFTAFFSIYLRTRRERAEMARQLAAAGAARGAALSVSSGGPTGGLSSATVNALPAFVYSEVKHHKLGKGALECAVCLSEFEDQDNLRLLPKCDHVFHVGCIDAWLAAHKTCPVCRADVEAAAIVVPPASVAITVEREEETTAATAAETAERWRIGRSNTTGHSLEERERYRLRLPETVREDVVAGRFRRTASCLVTVPEGAVSAPVGRSSLKTRWASFKRSLSMKVSRGDGAGTSASAGRSSVKVNGIEP